MSFGKINKSIQSKCLHRDALLNSLREKRSRLDTLADTEREVFELRIQGFSKKYICEQLGINMHDLKKTIKSMDKKLGVFNKKQLIVHYCDVVVKVQ